MLHKGAGDGCNSQSILKWPRYYIFCNNSKAKTKLSVNLVVSEALTTQIKNGGKASANCMYKCNMQIVLHVGAGS